MTETVISLAELGWNSSCQEHFAAFKDLGYQASRVIREHKEAYQLCTERGELSGEVSGRFRHQAQSKDDFPAVGDWVAVEGRPGEAKATIHAVLPRKSAFSRTAAGGKTEAQVVAANVDTAFLVSGLDGDFNVRRIERYLTLAWDSGSAPVVVLNKSDVCPEVEARVDEVERIAIGVPVLPISAVEGRGLDSLRERLGPGRTGVFLGSSGVGKSTLINALLGTARMKVRAVRQDDSHGRHTTTHRELIVLPGGGIVIDTPGMRELQLWSDEAGLKQAFDDIAALAEQCRFRDCAHRSEPGCAIRRAIKLGTLDARRYESYLKLNRELRYLDARQDQRERLLEKAQWKKISAGRRKRNRPAGPWR